MSETTDEEIKLLEKKLELLRQIKELEDKQTPPVIRDPQKSEDQEIRESIEKLSEKDKWKLFLKRKDLTGPFRGSESE